MYFFFMASYNHNRRCFCCFRRLKHLHGKPEPALRISCCRSGPVSFHSHSHKLVDKVSPIDSRQEWRNLSLQLFPKISVSYRVLFKPKMLRSEYPVRVVDNEAMNARQLTDKMQPNIHAHDSNGCRQRI